MTELFEKYHSNLLSEKERLNFEQKLKSDDSFAQDFDAYMMMMDHLENKDEINVALKNLNDIHLDAEDEKPKSKSRIFRFLTIALLLSIFGYTLFYVFSTTKNTPLEPQELFATHFSPAPISLATKGNDDAKLLAQINLDYNNNKHTSVINALNQINIDSIGENRLYLMLGSSLIANGSFEKSRTALKTLESSAQFKNDFYWYTGLSYLGENNINSAKSYFLQIPESSNYRSKAQSILSQFE